VGEDSTIHTSRYWRERAEEARSIAESMLDCVARATMLDIASKYDLMARRAAERERQPKAGATSSTAAPAPSGARGRAR
jgi:hypothetical protein